MKLSLLFCLLLSTVNPARADQITFSFVAATGNAVDMVASKAAGMESGPAQNITISDTTKGEHKPLAGIFTSSAGPATSFVKTTDFIIATFSPGADNSVLIVSPLGQTLIAGDMENNGALLAQYPGGTGSYLGSFTVTEVAPSVLSLFGLRSFNPNGSVAFTFGQDKLKGKTLDAVVGGGSVTFLGTAAPVPEPASAALLGVGLVTLGIRFRNFRVI